MNIRYYGQLESGNIKNGDLKKPLLHLFTIDNRKYVYMYI